MAKQSLLQKFGKLSEAKKLLVFLLVFVIIGGGYMAYKSFAAEISFDSSGTIAPELIDTSLLTDISEPPDVIDSGSCKRTGSANFTWIWYNSSQFPEMDGWGPRVSQAAYYPKIKLGDNNECVRLYKKMWNFIIEKGFQSKKLDKVNETTKFDDALLKQVKTWQRLRSNEIELDVKEIKTPPSGIVDELTWATVSWLYRWNKAH